MDANGDLAGRKRLAFLVVTLWAGGFASAAPGAPFQPAGMWAWDNWLVHDGQQWHAFYLQLPKAVGPERRWQGNDPYKHVGHAVSQNLFDWQDAGPALCALSGTWNDRHIATGSIFRHGARWGMVFTGRGRQGDGVGLAWSDDLIGWRTEPQPLFPLMDTFAGQGPAPFASSWEGKAHRWVGISDPYILPEAREGWYYLVLCARILDVPLPQSGCVAMVRSRDLRQWEAAGILAWPRCFERLETPQLWEHGARWYLSFGGVLDVPWTTQNPAALPGAVRGKRSHQNYCYALPAMLGPGRSEDLHHLAVPSGHYIMKVLLAPSPGDTALFTATGPSGTGISQPYRVVYLADGALQLDPLPRTGPAPGLP